MQQGLCQTVQAILSHKMSFITLVQREGEDTKPCSFIRPSRSLLLRKVSSISKLDLFLRYSLQVNNYFFPSVLR